MIRPHRRHRSTTYVDAVYSYRPSSVVCRSVTLVSPAKTIEPIEMPFGVYGLGWAQGVQNPDPMGRGNFKGKGGGLL